MTQKEQRKEKRSAGILLYRLTSQEPEIFLVHPGGPFWKNKDAGAWTIPKGEPEEDEDLETTAYREFFEETGFSLTGVGFPLTPVRQKAGKWVYAWMLEADLDPAVLKSNDFETEWPPKSGRISRFPEVDRFAWFSFSRGREKINAAQVVLIDELERRLKDKGQHKV